MKFLSAHNLLNPQVSLSEPVPLSVGSVRLCRAGTARTVWWHRPARVLQAAQGQRLRGATPACFRPRWAGMKVCWCCKSSRLCFSNCVAQLQQKCGDSGLRIGCFPLSQVMPFLTRLAVAEDMWHHRLFVSLAANPLWAACVPSPPGSRWTLILRHPDQLRLGLPAFSRGLKSVKFL